MTRDSTKREYKVKTYRLESRLFEYLKARAKLHRRTINAELNTILAALLEETKTVSLEETAEADERGPLDTVSGYRGVYPYGNRWVARKGKDQIAVCASPREAAEAYDKFVRETSPHSIASKRVNFPRESELNRNADDDDDALAYEQEMIAAGMSPETRAELMKIYRGETANDVDSPLVSLLSPEEEAALLKQTKDE